MNAFDARHHERIRILSTCRMAVLIFFLAVMTPLNFAATNGNNASTTNEIVQLTSQKNEDSSTITESYTSPNNQDLMSHLRFSSKVTVPESLVTTSTTQNKPTTEPRIDIFKSHFHHVGVLLYIAITTFISALLVLGYHHCHTLTLYIPESCFLLCIGIIAGCIIRFTSLDYFVPETFSPDTFFLVLLPPIILGASYSLNNRIFYDNLGVVLLFAVVGTAAACFLIAPFLCGLSQTSALILPSHNLFKQIFVFSAFIVAVDPVAVLAVFSELGVNKPLHIVVFGESLLNDGVSVVLYRVMININKMNQITGEHVGFGILKFLACVVISCLIGCTAGVTATLVCKYSHSRHIMEPVILVTTAYIAYLISEALDLSGILGMIVCGLVQAQYAFHNINSKSRTSTKFIIKVISTSAELVIFIFLGISVARTRHQWNVGFILWSLFACIVSRVIVTFLFSFFVNKFHGERMKIFSFQEQIIMAYGGLRGGVAFSLSLQLDEKDVPLRNTFITTVLIIILFNVIIQGITIRPLVNILKVKLEEKLQKNLLTTINNKLIDETLQLMEKVVGRRSGHNMWRKRAEVFELNHIQYYLLKSPHSSESKIESVHEKVAMRAMHDFLLSLHSPIPSTNTDIHNRLPLSNSRSSVLSDHFFRTRFSSIQELHVHRLSNVFQPNQPQRHTPAFRQNYAIENQGFQETEDSSADAFHNRSRSLNSTNQRKQSKTANPNKKASATQL